MSPAFIFETCRLFSRTFFLLFLNYNLNIVSIGKNSSFLLSFQLRKFHYFLFQHKLILFMFFFLSFFNSQPENQLVKIWCFQQYFFGSVSKRLTCTEKFATTPFWDFDALTEYYPLRISPPPDGRLHNEITRYCS